MCGAARRNELSIDEARWCRVRPPGTLAQAAHGPKRRNNSHVPQHIDLADPQSSDVFGENDPARRARRLTKSSPKIACSTIHRGVYRGRDEIDRIAGEVRATHLDFRYQPIAEPEEVGNGGRVKWQRAALARRRLTPVLISSLPGRRIAAVYLFFDKL